MRSVLLSNTIIVLALCLFGACKTKEGPKILPAVSTTVISDVTDSSATIGGNVAEEGSSALESVGVCWSLLKGPTRVDSHLVSGGVKGDFQFAAKGFKNNTTYYVRAFATNKEGISYGNELSLKTKPGWVYITPVVVAYVTSVLTLNDGSVLMGSHSGVFRSLNNGITWTAVNNGITNLKVNCFTQIGTTIYAGTEGGVFKSSDSGVNWTAENTNLTSLIVNVLASSGTTICAGTTNGVFISTVAGSNWSAAAPIPGISNITLLTVFDNKIFAGSKIVKEIYSTENVGGSWTKLTKDFTVDMPTDIIAYSPKLIVSTSSGLFYSSDQGYTFEKVPGLNAQLFCVDVSNNTILAGGLSKIESLYRSKDYGNTFSVTENPGDNTTVFVTSMAANDAFLFVVSGNKMYRMNL